MFTSHDIMDQRARRVRAVSRVFAIIALSAAIPLCIVIAILFGIVFYPRGPDGTPLSEILDIPITGWQSLVLHQGPAVLAVVALFSLLMAGIGRGLKRQSQALAAAASASEASPKELTAPAPAAPPPALARKPGRWRSPASLAVMALVMAVLMLCALVPLEQEVFDTTGEADLESVVMVSANDGWIVGSFFLNVGGARAMIWHYHNGQWSLVPSPTKSGLLAVSALPNGDAWAVGFNGTILHEHKGAWSQMASGTTDNLFGIAMVSPTEGWAVGGNEPIASANNRFVAGASAPAAHSRFSPAVASQPRDDSFCRILHYIAGRWSPVSCPAKSPLQSVAALPDGEAWAVGYDGILHERQGVWEQVPSPAKGLESIALVSATEGWAVGDKGAILHEQNGVWSEASQLTSHLLRGVAVSANGEGWCMGSEGSMLHLTLGVWYADSIPAVSPDDYLFAITLLPGGQEGWAVGAGQLILHLHNGVWSLYSRQTSSKLPQ